MDDLPPINFKELMNALDFMVEPLWFPVERIKTKTIRTYIGKIYGKGKFITRTKIEDGVVYTKVWKI